jgi:hypothetical protein
MWWAEAVVGHWFHRGFQENLMCHKMAMKFIEGDRSRTQVQGCDDRVIFLPNIPIDDCIEFCLGDASASRTEFISKRLCLL